MRIFREKPGVISEKACWVVIDAVGGSGWLYIADSLLGLLWVVVTEWKHDKHLAG